MKKFMLIILYEIFFVSFMLPIAYFVYTIQLKQICEMFSMTVSWQVGSLLVVVLDKSKFIKKPLCVAQTIPTHSPTQAST